MNILRYLLIALNLVPLLVIWVLMFTKGIPHPASDLFIILGIMFGLSLNATYLVLNRPAARGRLRRLVGLWFDAKEAELRSRANAS
jgi:hypothetical protein